MDKPVIVFMGTPVFARRVLEELCREFGPPAAAVTQPDRPKGRGKKLAPPPVKEFADGLGVPVYQPVHTSDIAADIETLKPDFIAVAAFGQILEERILSIPARGCINVHASLLPEYRGASPINRAIIDGREATGVTTMLMGEGLDTGDMLLKREVRIAPWDTAGSLHDRLADAGAELCVETIEQFDSIVPEPQDDSRATFAPAMKKDDGKIDWNRPAEEIRNLVRGCDPWPGTYTFHGGEMLKIWKTKTAPGKPDDVEPGTVVEAGGGGIVVACGNGLVKITELQRPGKKRQEAGSFLRGYSIEKGDRLTPDG